MLSLLLKLLNLGEEPPPTKKIVCVVHDGGFVPVVSEDWEYFHDNPLFAIAGIVNQGDIEFRTYEWTNKSPE